MFMFWRNVKHKGGVIKWTKRDAWPVAGHTITVSMVTCIKQSLTWLPLSKTSSSYIKTRRMKRNFQRMSTPSRAKLIKYPFMGNSKIGASSDPISLIELSCTKQTWLALMYISWSGPWNRRISRTRSHSQLLRNTEAHAGSLIWT